MAFALKPRGGHVEYLNVWSPLSAAFGFGSDLSLSLCAVSLIEIYKRNVLFVWVSLLFVIHRGVECAVSLAPLHNANNRNSDWTLAVAHLEAHRYADAWYDYTITGVWVLSVILFTDIKNITLPGTVFVLFMLINSPLDLAGVLHSTSLSVLTGIGGAILFPAFMLTLGANVVKM